MMRLFGERVCGFRSTGLAQQVFSEAEPMAALSSGCHTDSPVIKVKKPPKALPRQTGLRKAIEDSEVFN
jgi:hypothetical protein